MCDGFSEAGASTAIGGMSSAAAASAAASAAAAGGLSSAAAGGVGTTAGMAALLSAGTASTGILGTGITASQLLTGLQVVSALAGLGGMKATQVAGNKAADAQTQNALTARAQNANQVNLEAVQAHDAASQKINANNTAAREASGTALASSEVGGLSVDSMLGDISGKAGRYNSSVLQNLSATNAQLDNQMANVNTNAASVINQERIAPPPDYLGTALKIGDDVGQYLQKRGG